MTGFNEEKSNISDETMEKWLQLRDLTDIGEVPGVKRDGATAKKLKNAGISTGYKLLGKYLSLVKSKQHFETGQTNDAFKEFLDSAGTPASWRDTIVDGICQKLMNGDFVPRYLKVSRDLANRSNLSDQVLEKSQKKTYTGYPEDDIHGIGSETAKKIKNYSTWQLLGKLLQCDSVEQFETWCTDKGFSKSHRAAIVIQLVNRAKHGAVVPACNFDEEEESREEDNDEYLIRQRHQTRVYHEPATSPQAKTATADMMPLVVVGGLLLALFVIKVLL
jgi:hypothetical protein